MTDMQLWCARVPPAGNEAGVRQHQFAAPNAFVAFWKALWYCKSPFQLARGQCHITSPLDYPAVIH